MVLKFHFRGHQEHKLPRIIKKMILSKNLTWSKLDKMIVKNSKINTDSLISIDSIANHKSKYFNFANRSSENFSIREISDTLRYIKRVHKEINNSKNMEEIKEANLVEWREAARRLDNFFFVCSFLAVTITPIYLFHDYMFDESPETFNKLSRCIIKH